MEILELIGQGGMGFVFKARQPKLDRLVALKILSQSLAVDSAFADRFTREGRVLAKLSHPNIVAVYDFGQAHGFFFLLMEFVDGVNLRQSMQAGRFTPAQALAVVPKVCEALQFAHNEGILHRDIKPENILLDTKGRVKIADFGIAKLVGEPSETAPLTACGSALGSPHYMAPEQIEKPSEVDHRADIYSLGVVFYEMLTGELPLGRFAPPSERSSADRRLDEVVMRALEKEPGRRQQSVGDVKTQVDTIATTVPTAGAATPARLKPATAATMLSQRYPKETLWLAGVSSLLIAFYFWSTFAKWPSLDSNPYVLLWPVFVLPAIATIAFLRGRRLVGLAASGPGQPVLSDEASRALMEKFARNSRVRLMVYCITHVIIILGILSIFPWQMSRFGSRYPEIPRPIGWGEG